LPQTKEEGQALSGADQIAGQATKVIHFYNITGMKIAALGILLASGSCGWYPSLTKGAGVEA
jgi:hypothetical protein